MFTPKPTVGDTSWFVEARLGMFIHWGLYALPSRHEWVASQEQIPPEAYQKYFERLTPRFTIPANGPKRPARPG